MLWDTTVGPDLAVMAWQTRSPWIITVTIFFALLGGILIAIAGRYVVRHFLNDAPRVFPELTEYPDQRSRDQALMNATKNRWTWIVSMIVVLPFVVMMVVLGPLAPLFRSPEVVTSDSPPVSVAGIWLVVLLASVALFVAVPILTRNAIRAKLRDQLSQRRESDPTGPPRE